jgi:hypothetical protein
VNSSIGSPLVETLDNNHRLAASNPALEPRVGAFKGPHSGFECCVIRNRAFARPAPQADAATTAMIVKVHDVTARTMKRFSEAASVGALEGAVGD